MLLLSMRERHMELAENVVVFRRSVFSTLSQFTNFYLHR